MWHYLCFQKYPQNTTKIGKTGKKTLDQFLTLDLDQLLALETPNLGPVFNSTAYIYIDTYIRQGEKQKRQSSKTKEEEKMETYGKM